MLVMARNNLRNAGIPFEVPLKQIEAQEVKPPVEGPGVVLTNPPYGDVSVCGVTVSWIPMKWRPHFSAHSVAH
jgi:23S rRNA G2445 N2-methylase RlmL